jgi:hypothetical protein
MLEAHSYSREAKLRKLTLLAATALFVLTACDQIPFLQGDKVEANGSVAATNAAAGNASAAATPSDAGITSSRSLAGLAAGNPDGGGKDPAAAIEAGARQGTLDPRLVGRWSDSGDCKDAVELRADGSFRTHNNLGGRWQVEGDFLVFSGNATEVRLRLDSVEPNRIVNTDAQGNTGQTTRC